MKLNEKAAYVKGLADGLNLDKNKAEGKLILALIELVDEMAAAIGEIDEDLNYLNDYIEEIDEDLGNVEEYLLDEDDDCDCDCCDDDCDCCCDDEDEEYYEVECPACGRVVCFDVDMDPENLVCPACNEKFECLIDAEELEKLDGEEE